MIPLRVIWSLCGIISAAHLILAVKIPPTITKQTMNFTYPYVVGESFKLVCEASGDPPPTFMWRRNDEDFDWTKNAGRYTKYPGQGTLVFISPQMDDDGIYQCLAINDLGTALSYKFVVRRAELLTPPKESDTSVSIRLGDRVKFDCRIPQSYPDPTIGWFQIDRSTGNQIFLPESNRISIDPVDGSLKIANVEANDGNKDYYCQATNRITRSSTNGRKYSLTVDGSTPVYTKAEHMDRFPDTVMALQGETKRLYCMFAGNPTPTINWRKGGVLIESKTDEWSSMRVLDSGTRLELLDISKAKHAGRYQCDGTNERNGGVPDSMTFTVQVQSKPYWKPGGEPKSVSVEEGGSHSIECGALGDPVPEVTWYVNGKLHQNTPTRRLVGEKLVFEGVTVENDPCALQCNASNSHGYIFSSIYFNVLREPPVFTVPPYDQTKASGSSFTMPCQTFSAPPAVVTWKKNGEPVTGGRYDIQTNGDLFIKELSITDAGIFECNASNTFGSETRRAKLTVRQPTTISVAPKDTKIYEKQEVKLVCTATTDQKEEHNLKIIWSKDGTVIDLADNPRLTVNPQDYSLIVSGTQPLDTGIYSCNATNGIDWDSRDAQLTILGRPEMPTNVEADCSRYKDQKIAVVKWNPGADNNAHILRYIVEFSTQFARDTWYLADLMGDNRTMKSDTEVKVLMRPFIQYRFRVKGVNIVGESEPSTHTTNTNCQLNPQKPDKNPTNLWAEGNLPQNIIVYWTPLSPLDFNGPRVQYKLRIRCLNCDQTTDKQYNETTIDNPFQEKVEFIKIRFGVDYSVEPYKRYEVEIYSRNAEGDSTSPVRPRSVGYSGEMPPTVTPVNVEVAPGEDVIKADQVKIKWSMASNPETDTRVQGYFRGFRLEWCLSGYTSEECLVKKRYIDYIVRPIQGPSMVGQFVRTRRQAVGTEFSAWLTHLPGKSKIKIWIRLLNKFYAGPPSEVIEVETKEGTPGQVGEFVLANTGVNHLEFEWLAPPQTNGVLTGYQLAYQEIIGLTTGYMTFGPKINDPMQTRGSVAGLKPNTNYRVYIYAQTSAGSGEPTFLDVRTAPPNQAPSRPTFTVIRLTDTGFNVTFEPSREGIAGSVFYVQYRVPGRSKWFETQREYRQRWIAIYNLEDDQWYEVRVVATNGAAMTTYTDSVKVRTGGEASPNALQGASATWFICMLLILIVLIIFMIFLCYVRKRRLDYFRGKQVPTYYETRGDQPPPSELPPGMTDPYATTQLPLDPHGYHHEKTTIPRNDRAPSYTSEEEKVPLDTPPRVSLHEDAYTPVEKHDNPAETSPRTPPVPPKKPPKRPPKPQPRATDEPDRDDQLPPVGYGRTPTASMPGRGGFPPEGGIPLPGYQPPPGQPRGSSTFI